MRQFVGGRRCSATGPAALRHGGRRPRPIGTDDDGQAQHT